MATIYMQLFGCGLVLYCCTSHTCWSIYACVLQAAPPSLPQGGSLPPPYLPSVPPSLPPSALPSLLPPSSRPPSGPSCPLYITEGSVIERSPLHGWLLAARGCPGVHIVIHTCNCKTLPSTPLRGLASTTVLSHSLLLLKVRAASLTLHWQLTVATASLSVSGRITSTFPVFL